MAPRPHPCGNLWPPTPRGKPGLVFLLGALLLSTQVGLCAARLPLQKVGQHSVAQALLCVAFPPRTTRATPAGGGALSPPGQPYGCPGSPGWLGVLPPRGRDVPPCAHLFRTTPVRPALRTRPLPAAPAPRSSTARASNQAPPPDRSSSCVPAWLSLTIHQDNPRPFACSLSRRQ